MALSTDTWTRSADADEPAGANPFGLTCAEADRLDMRRWSAPLLFAGVCFGLFDFFVAYLFRPMVAPELGFVAIAVLGAQASLIAIWVAIAPVSLLERTLVLGVLAFTFYWCGITGFAMSIQPTRAFLYEVLVVSLGSAPILLLALQLPLWMTKLWWTYGVVRVDRPNVSRRARSITIKDLLLATAVVAVALTLPRLSAATVGQPLNEYMLGLGVAAAALVLWGCGVVFPLVLFLLTVRRTRLALLAASASALVTWAVALTITVIVSGTFYSASQAMVVFVVIGTYYLLTGGGLFAARICGYRIQLSGKLSPASFS